MCIDALIRYFENHDETDKAKGIYTVNTDVGLYKPSNLRHIKDALTQLIEDGTIGTSPFLDTGSGDGRVVALAALLGMAAVGIEYHPSLVQRAEERLVDLYNMGFLVDANLEIIQGDFLQDSTYQGRGLKFEVFGIVFDYITRTYRDVAKKVAEQSKPGTVFLLYGMGESVDFKGLTLERSLELRDESEKEQSIDFTSDREIKILGWETVSRKLDVYRKFPKPTKIRDF